MQKYSRYIRTVIAVMSLTLALSARPVAAEESEPNTLSAEEKAAGWQLLFDGKTASQWRSFGKPDFPASGWQVAGGWLTKKTAEHPGNIVTREKFTDFEFSWEWRMAAGGNNGVKYFVDEERGNLGHEYQMLLQPGRKLDKGSNASFYAVLAPSADIPSKVAPEVNQSRIVVRGNRVQHWLNGKLALEYECDSEEVLANVANSKFKKAKDFGKKLTAHIMLTDHGSECSFRNLKVRALPAK